MKMTKLHILQVYVLPHHTQKCNLYSILRYRVCIVHIALDGLVTLTNDLHVYGAAVSTFVWFSQSTLV